MGARLATQDICEISMQSSWLLPKFAQNLGWIAYFWENLRKILLKGLAGRITQTWSLAGYQED